MTRSGVEVRETGTVTEVRRGIIKLDGLPSCILGQVIELGPEAKAFVIGFTDTEVLALAVGEQAQVTVGQRVEVQQQPLRIAVGRALLGRVVSPLGEPLDGEAAPQAEAWRPIFHEAPGIMARSPVVRQLHTGVKVIDTMLPLGRGQRELIIGDRMTGKSTLALDAIVNQRGHDTICIYCGIGQSQQKIRQVQQLLDEQGVMRQTVVVAAPASREASEQFLAPYAACAIGEQFMAQGRDVLVVFDDLSKHAWAYRQLSLLLERPPGREAYPGDMFYIHAQFMERAGQLGPAQGGGSMTFLPICETQQGDVTGYISSNLISMTDGQIYLSTELFYEGTKPAIDVGLSVSRIGNRVQSPLLKWVSGSLRLEFLQYRELLRLSRFSSTLSEEASRKRAHGALLRRLLLQGAHQPVAPEDLVLLLYAYKTGRLDQVTEEGLRVSMSGLAARLPGFAKEALTEPALTPAVHAKLESGLDEVLRIYQRHETGTRDAIAEAPAR